MWKSVADGLEERGGRRCLEQVSTTHQRGHSSCLCPMEVSEYIPEAKTFANFVVLPPCAKVFSAKFSASTCSRAQPTFPIGNP